MAEVEGASGNASAGGAEMQMMQMMQMMAASGGSPEQMMQVMQMMQQMGSADQTGATQQATTTSDWGKGSSDWGKGGGKDKGPGEPSDNLYIRGLPSPQVDSEMLLKLFTDLGFQVGRHKLIADTRGVGSSAAMVQLASVEQAVSALTQLNGQELLGNQLVFTFVQPAKGCGKGAPQGGADIGKGWSSKYLIIKQKEAGLGDNLFVGGLPSPTVDQAELNRIFEQNGYTVARSRLLPDTRGKGFSSALVQLASGEEANAAMEALNGKPIDAFNLVPMELPEHLDPSKVDNMEPTHGNLFIGNIPKEFEEKELMEVFKQCGTIVSCKISRAPGGISKGSGFVRFETKEEAKIAIEYLNGFNNLMVKPADSDVREKGDGKGKEIAAWFKGGWGKDAWGKDNWGKDNWGKDSWGQEAKVIAPPIRVATQSQTPEAELIAAFAGENGEDSPSDTLFILGLPSPAVEEHRLLEVFTGMGVTPTKVETLEDDSDAQCSAAMVQFASIEAASQARTAVNGKTPSQLGLLANGGGVTNGMKGKGKPTYGKAAAPWMMAGPYSQGGKGVAKNGWNAGGWDAGWGAW